MLFMVGTGRRPPAARPGTGADLRPSPHPAVGLQPDTRHVFPLPADQPGISSVRLDAHPDGGISRVRLWGVVDPAARRAAGCRWFNALPQGQARYVLQEHGVPAELAARLTAARPLTGGRSVRMQPMPQH